MLFLKDFACQSELWSSCSQEDQWNTSLRDYQRNGRAKCDLN